jgi:bifunctional non-homologous end joining protein LigD
MQTERAELYFRQGSSDKVYHLQLENTQDRWSVQAQWGRRGSALQSDSKVSDTTYEDAKRVYDRLLREKTGKGYQIGFRKPMSGKENQSALSESAEE